MAETFSRFDAADYLTTDEAIAAYLDDAGQDGDPAAMARALGTVARAQKTANSARRDVNPGGTLIGALAWQNGKIALLLYQGNRVRVSVIARALATKQATVGRAGQWIVSQGLAMTNP